MIDHSDRILLGVMPVTPCNRATYAPRSSGLLIAVGNRAARPAIPLSLEERTMTDRMSLSRILAPTDFSDCATGAVEYAKLLARRFGAAITLLHAASPRARFEPLPLTGM